MANVVAEGRAVEVVELPRYRKPKRGQEVHDKEAIAVAKRHGVRSYNYHSKEILSNDDRVASQRAEWAAY